MRIGTSLTPSCKFWRTTHTTGKPILILRSDYQVIMQHLWKKLASKPKDWRRIYKALHVMEYLIKNGAPRCIQEIKDEMFKIRSFQDFSYNDNGTDRGSGLRDKARAVCELLSVSARKQRT